jgi:hypothetical protein
MKARESTALAAITEGRDRSTSKVLNGSKTAVFMIAVVLLCVIVSGLSLKTPPAPSAALRQSRRLTSV